MKMLRFAAPLLAMFAVAQVHGYALNAGGLSGLLSINTADTLRADESYLNLAGGADIFYDPAANNRDLDLFMNPALLYGVSRRFEVGLQAHPVYLIDSSDYGIRDLAVAGKYRFLGDRASGYGVALAAHGSLFKADESRNLGTADSSYGVELVLSRYGSAGGLHLALGSKVDDIRVKGATPAFVSDDMLTAAAAFELTLLPEFTFSLEVLGSKRMSAGDENLQVMPGVRFRPNNSLSYMFGIAYGLPSDRSDPEVRYLAGVTVALNAQEPFQSVSTRMDEMNRSLAGLESRIEERAVATPEVPADVADRLAGLESSQLKLQQRLESMEEQAEDSGLPSNAIRVAVVNASGIDRLGRLVGDTLRKQGYRVTAVSDIRQAIKEPTQIFYKGGASKNAEIVRIADAKLDIEEVTSIYYREGFDEVAIALGHTLPKNQMILKGPKLDERIDLQVVVGRDMKILLLSGLKR